MKDRMRHFLDRLHELSEWESSLAYRDGYAAGYAAAQAEIHAAMRLALGGPQARSWRHAADTHHRAIAFRSRRERADQRGPRPGDYLGGPVDFDTGLAKSRVGDGGLPRAQKEDAG